MNIEIATYWNVETLYYVFNAVAALMAGAGFAGLLKFVFISALAIGMFAYMGGKQLEMVMWFFHALIFVTLLNLPIARVAITDKTGLEPPRVVDNVPFALAVTAQTTNLVFGYLTRSYETIFGVPDDLGLQKGDVGFGHRILKQVNSATIQDPGLRADLMQFIKECTLYDLRDGAITPQQIISGTDTWNTLFHNTNPARFVTLDTLSGNPQTKPCTEAAALLKIKVNAAVTAAQTFYGKQSFTRAQSDHLATSLFVNAVGTSYDWLLQNSQNASEAMRQAMFNNIWRDAGTDLPALLGDSARVDEVSAMASAAQAARSADGSNSTLSLLAQETLPHMRNWIEAIIYALFPIVVILTVVVSTEGAKKIIAGYLMSLAWIGLWPVLFAVINHLSLMHLKHKANALALASGVPFQLSDAFDATLSNEQAMIGYMVVLVPFIAAAIIRMGQGGFMSIADKATSGFTAAGSTAGAAWAAGNVSLGQAGLDTASVNTTSMHKMDSNIGLSGGGASIATASGGSMRIGASGVSALEQMHNRFLTSLSTDTRFDAQRSQEPHETNITSTGQQLSSRQSHAASLSHIRATDQTRGHYQNHGTDMATTTQGGYSQIAGHGESMSKANRESSSFHMASGITDSGNFGLGISGDLSHTSGEATARSGKYTKSSRDAQRISRAMEQGGASQESIDDAMKNYQSHQNAKGNSNSPSSTQGHVSLGGNLGITSTKIYTASHARDRVHDESHAREEHARTETHYGQSGAKTNRSGLGEQSAQSHRQASEASQSYIHERSQISDVSDRRELGTGHRASRSESHSIHQHRDLLADPSFMEAVAQRNGMSAMRFYSQETPTIMSMAQSYMEERGIVASSKNLNTNTFSDSPLPANKADLAQQSQAERNQIHDDITSNYRKKAAQTGFTDTSALAIDAQTSPIITGAQNTVQKKHDPNHSSSITHRSAAFNENIDAWASHDKEIGEGRANPAGVTQNMAVRDVADYGLKIWDKLKGGDGTADGEKLTENEKRETGSSLPMSGDKK